jgi:carbon monoxide dehydrogenase subunit G
MPSIREDVTIPYPLAEVWPLLSDPALVASCIPGATLSPDQSDGLWRGSVKVKFGPTVAVFRGEAKLDFDHTAHRCTIDGRGIDGRGASRALASGVVAASGDATTSLAIDGTFSVTGPLETFANAGGVHVARALLQEFSGNIVKVIAERQGAPAATQDAQAVAETSAPQSSTSPRPAAAAEISAFRIAWLTLKSWLNGLFGKRTR